MIIIIINFNNNEEVWNKQYLIGDAQSCGNMNPALNLECNQCPFASDGMTTVNNEVVSDFNAANELYNLKVIYHQIIQQDIII